MLRIKLNCYICIIYIPTNLTFSHSTDNKIENYKLTLCNITSGNPDFFKKFAASPAGIFPEPDGLT